jgi:hypothetical protein
VAAIFGAEVGLKPTNAVKLLESYITLYLFTPSIDLLEAFKSVTKTVIDLPELKLGDNIPLIIYW